jgi:PPM family protein phosphatase
MTESETNTTAVADDQPEIVVRVFGRTDVGLVREHNEDNFLIADLTSANRSILPEVRTHRVGTRGTVFTVCDGMGGAAAGEVASRLGIDTIYEILQGGDAPVGDVGLARRLNEAICEAGTRIFTAAKLNRAQRGMGTTVTAAVLNGPRLIVGQVGDSRAHIVRRGAIVQVTKDQSLVQQLIDAKQLTHEEAKAFDRSNIILQALGTTEEVHVDVTSVPLRRGDALVMCSDGLSGRVDPDVICRVVRDTDEPMDACRMLTELACENGGDDNITVIVARFDGDGLPECGEDDVVMYQPFAFRQLTETTVRAAIPHFEETVAPEATPVAAPPPEVAPATGAEPAPEPAPSPSTLPLEAKTDIGEKDKAPAKQEAPKAAPAKEKAPEPPAPSRAEEPPAAVGGKGRSKAIVGVVVAAVACVGIGYFAMRGGGAGETGQGAESSAPASAAAIPAAPVTPTAARPDRPVAPPIAEPRLAPTAEDRIVGTGGGTAASEPTAAPKQAEKTGKKKVAAPADGEDAPYGAGSGDAVKPSEKKKVDKKEPAATPAPKKKPEDNIEENPY